MENNDCAFCAAHRKVKRMAIAMFLSVLAGVILGEWVRPVSRDLDTLVFCMGFGGSIMFFWEYYKDCKTMEKVRRQQGHEH